ncbi:MAG: MBL fold metallo-hydrolase [Clostridia bacterium]|nr:MBL fold metallo-hydrolase [Clostridia bacterium]
MTDRNKGKRMIPIVRLFVSLAAMVIVVCVLTSCNTGPVEPKVTPTPAVDVEGKLQIYCYSIGAADAFLIYTENGTVLIDTGEDNTDSIVYDYIKKNADKKIDYIIITHFDKDHIGGAEKIIKKCEIGEIIRPKYVKESDKYNEYSQAVLTYGVKETIAAEDIEFTLDGVTYTVYPPMKDYYDESQSNNSSLIISVKYGSKSFLFTGDAEKARISEFLTYHTEKYDFLKMPYHGRWYKALTFLCQIVDPEYAVITSSDKDPEDKTTIALLDQSNINYYLTRSAPVIVKCDGTDLSVEYVK